MAYQEEKVEIQHMPSRDPESDEPKKGLETVVLRTSTDNLGVWAALKLYKRVAFVAMIAAFSASLDGYQVNLNGSIVSNKGFIQQMAPAGTTILNAEWVSAWGGIQSAGQFFGQIFLQYGTEALGRRVALWITWLTIVISVAIESVAKHPSHWLVAKLFAGMGVGMMQGTLPMYISEQSPSQLRGLLINAYTFWFVVGQLLAPTALQVLNTNNPYNFRDAIYTQWAMVGILALIYVFLPESPWWLVSKGKLEQAEKILHRHHGHIEGYDVKGEVAIMAATIDAERQTAKETNKTGEFAIFKGTNGWRLFISCWPKVMQQFVGLTVFNTYSTYFFQLAGNKDPFLVTVILACVQLISVLIVCFTTDTWGRRPTTVYGYMITTLAMFGIGAVGTSNYASKSLGSLLIFFGCLATFATTASSAIGYAYLAEIPKQDLRARNASWGLAFSNLWAIMFSFVTPILLKGKPAWGVKTGFFFGCTGTIVCVVGWFILPEIARRTPAEIDEMFEKKVPPRQFKNYVTDVQKQLEFLEAVEGVHLPKAVSGGNREDTRA